MIQIDMPMPERCGVCFAMHTDEIGLESWCGIDETARDIYTEEINTKRPDWCPLKEQDKRWIPVTERLPRSIANKVLVYVQHEDYVGYIGYGHYEKYKGQEMWFDLEHNEEFSKRGYHVTHWMETPMPPMEGR